MSMPIKTDYSYIGQCNPFTDTGQPILVKQLADDDRLMDQLSDQKTAIQSNVEITSDELRSKSVNEGY